MNTITLADGTVIENGYIINSANKVWFYIENGMNIREVFGLMADPEKTETITAQDGNVYRGFTDLFTIMKNGNLISGGLQKPEIEE